MLQSSVLNDQDQDFTIRVKANSNVQQIANTIRIAIFGEHKMPVVRAIGAGGVNQACKGIAIARGLVATQGYDLGMNVGFSDVVGDDGHEITALAFRLYLK